MKQFPVKQILLLAGVVLGFMVISAWYVFLKPGRSIKNEAGISVTSGAIYKVYRENEKSANAIYLDKAISVTGKISEIKTNLQGQQVIVLETEDPIFGIVCTMQKPFDATRGMDIKIKGFCTGYTTDVVLRDCINEN
jgi:chloramphenicol O-acetyltransferase